MTRPVVRLPAWVDRFDEVVDRAWEPLRGVPPVDAVFYAASTAADYSLLWHGCNLARLLRGRAGPAEVLRVAVAIGAESLVVNQGLKRLFVRARPDRAARASVRTIRRPRTTSFPSGHASSAVVATSLLAEGDPLAPLYRVAGAVVATSRVHVCVHHASDVVAGAVVGAALVRTFRRCWPRR